MNYSNPQLANYLILDAFPKFGAARLNKLTSFFTSPDLVLKATLHELVTAGIEPKLAEEFINYRVRISGDKLLDGLIKENIGVVFCFEDEYPINLKRIRNHPFLLYYRGKLQNITHPLAIVGSRNFSRYGSDVTIKIAGELAKAGLTIVSGLALGIDALAHLAALDNQGLTWGILGSGLDAKSLYPVANRKLADRLIDSGGCLLSEMRPGTDPMPFHFPMRNRIIAGLTFGTLVIEAAAKSGSLITAEYAKEYNREVFAVPGAINNPLCAGTNLLIKQGARAVTESADILELLDLKALTSYSKNNSYTPASKEEAILLSFLSHEGLHIDELVHLAKQPVYLLHSQLAILEIKGAVKNIGNMEYIKLS